MFEGIKKSFFVFVFLFVTLFASVAWGIDWANSLLQVSPQGGSWYYRINPSPAGSAWGLQMNDSTCSTVCAGGWVQGVHNPVVVFGEKEFLVLTDNFTYAHTRYGVLPEWFRSQYACSDGIKNGTETGIDCGGSCPACADSCAGKDFIGGCNGLPKYCEGSSEYESAYAFATKFPDIGQWWYNLSIGSDGEQYKCMSFYKDSAGKITLNIFGSGVDPKGSSSCMTTTAAAAFGCIRSGLSGTYSGVSTKYSSGIKGICVDPVTGAYINCGVSKTDVGNGATVTQDAGTGETVVSGSDGTVEQDTRITGGSGVPLTGAPCFDLDKNGVDDFTGLPCVTGGGVNVKGKIGGVAGGACVAYTYKNKWETIKTDISTSMDGLPVFGLINKLKDLSGVSGFPRQYRLNLGSFMGNVTLDLDAWHFTKVLAVLRWCVLAGGFWIAWRLAVGGE